MGSYQTEPMTHAEFEQFVEEALEFQHFLSKKYADKTNAPTRTLSEWCGYLKTYHGMPENAG